MQTLKEKQGKYSLKVDDLLLRLLKDYHQLDSSSVVSWFSERANEMLQAEPNITNNSRSPVTLYVDKSVGKTVTFGHKYTRHNNAFRMRLREMDTNGNKVYVLRGFFPDTHIPFKMTLANIKDMETAFGKVKIGLKEHHTKFTENDIREYNEAVSEAILLGKEIDESKEIEYEYRKFKCMRPKGMKLYHEKES